MKPVSDTTSFLDRFNNFIDGEFRNIEILSPTNMKITLTSQDKNRDFDWVSVNLEFSSINDANILDNNKLALLDMQEGMSLIKENGNFAFAYGRCANLSSIKSSTFYIISSTLKFEEGSF